MLAKPPSTFWQEAACSPQKITEKKDVTVYFRVADVYKNTCIKVYDGDKLLYKKKKIKFAPGEMESVVIKKELLDGVSELMFKIEE